ncbi:heterokaryon incompatibility protein-domain-containing protein [Pseudomassariella vexata]|uniref:Heterokaryon incompatibility protein-domain-containing protein n=1 Tax=Pseudomassariella vexata TaxID=1141098 RepID=A0A1Y2DD60_9PEZI|nr:heterokaryon incompatibility protein-domain-containing protein [Pseudomassariella vexata]ORY57211.1 heterokaryon incompatibility protein-domain-containing protein [Pseudomassariella vexata]
MTAPNSTIYDGLPLICAREEIRVLHLHDGSGDDKVVCTLEKVSLDDNPTFNALSYVWGDATITAPVTINGRILNVTRSLELALKHIRNYHTTLTSDESGSRQALWADAVCINQDDTAERAEQVQLMNGIYSKAFQVLIWLGDGTKHTDFAIDRMNGLKYGLDTGFQVKPCGHPSMDDIRVEVVLKQDICEREWWRRLWVRQEFLLADGEPVFLCGQKSVVWSLLLLSFLTVPRAWDYPQLAGKWEEVRKDIIEPSTGERYRIAGIHLASLNSLRSLVREEGRIPLSDTFGYLSRNATATDPHDYIYGFLGLLNKYDQHRIRVDYTINPMELYQSVGRLLWTQHADDMLKNMIMSLHFHGEDNGYPSWTPDFQRQSRRGWRDHRALAADRSWREEAVDVRFLDNGENLGLRGIRFDRVDVVHTVPDSFSTISALRHHLHILEDLFAKFVLGSKRAQRDYPPDELKSGETLLELLTKSPLLEGDYCIPGYTDEEVWNIIMGRLNTLPADLASPAGETRRKLVTSRLMTIFSGKLFNRTFFVTDSGYPGVGVVDISEGDVVTFIFGMKAPLILRPYVEHDRIVGCAYVSGLVDQDVLDAFYENDLLQEQVFSIC